VSAYYRPAAIYGGPIESIHQRSLALTRFGHQVTTFTTDANGSGRLAVPTGTPVLVDELPVWYFPRWWFGREKMPRNLFFSKGLNPKLQKLRPGDFDLITVHASFCDPGRLAATAARRTGTPYIYYTHGAYEPWAYDHKRWKKEIYFRIQEKRILQGAAGIVVCNAAETEKLRKLGIQTAICRIPWGIQLPSPQGLPDRQRLETLFPFLRNRPYVLFLSRLHVKKGLDNLIKAFAALAPKYAGWLLVIAGPDEGGYQRQLETLAQSLGLRQRVLFTGMTKGESKQALLNHCEFLVLPSYSEGFPMAVAEALAFGRPVLITTSCYLPEVEQEEAGVIVEPQMTALISGLEKMMGEPAFREKCAKRALRLAKRNFTWEAVTRQTEVFYQEIVRCHSTV
jgi:glycosyltransferase involved in cell wall biosynthesis